MSSHNTAQSVRFKLPLAVIRTESVALWAYVLSSRYVINVGAEPMVVERLPADLHHPRIGCRGSQLYQQQRHRSALHALLELPFSLPRPLPR